MMLYVVDPLFDHGGADSCWLGTNHLQGDKQVLMNGGPAWRPDIKLAHEFSLLPHIDPISSYAIPTDHRARKTRNSRGTHISEGVRPESSQPSAPEEDVRLLGQVTPACSSVSDMQNRMFKLGFGPMPNFRRAGVLLNIAPNKDDDDDASSYMLGCIVAHRHGVHGCSCPALPSADHPEDQEDARCYFCCGNPFYEVLFSNGGGDPSQWRTVPVTPARACFRAVPVGTKMLVSVGTLAAIVPLFQVCEEVMRRVDGWREREKLMPCSFFAAGGASDTPGQEDQSAVCGREPATVWGQHRGCFLFRNELAHAPHEAEGEADEHADDESFCAAGAILCCFRPCRIRGGWEHARQRHGQHCQGEGSTARRHGEEPRAMLPQRDVCAELQGRHGLRRHVVLEQGCEERGEGGQERVCQTAGSEDPGERQAVGGVAVAHTRLGTAPKQWEESLSHKLV
jgi:hypothetical protein